MNRFNPGDLARTISGSVFAPSQHHYDEARAIWNARLDRRPDAIVRCHCASDVQAAVTFARDHNLLLSVKGGGHAFAANTVGEGGLLIDLSFMRGISVNPDERTARVEPGIRWRDLDPLTQEHGLATPGGTVSSVGVAGFTLGGGIGYLCRKYGLAVDNLLSAEVVTADGRLVRANADENSDLFWALRGGGGNFGVVTAFNLQLHEVGPQVLSGQIIYRFEDAARVLRSYREFMEKAPDETQCFAFVVRMPPIPGVPKDLHGRTVLDLVVFHSDAEDNAVFGPLMEFGEPILASVTPQPYTRVQQSFDAGVPPGQRWESRAQDLAQLSDELIETGVSMLGVLPGEFTMAYFSAGGGAMARVDPSATAFPHRGAPFSFHIMAGWAEPGRDDEIMSWVSELHQALTPFSTGGVYVNLLGTGEEGRVQAAYGGNYSRLVEIKKKWDPDNLFRMNHNIRVDR